MSRTSSPCGCIDGNGSIRTDSDVGLAAVADEIVDHAGSASVESGAIVTVRSDVPPVCAPPRAGATTDQVAPSSHIAPTPFRQEGGSRSRAPWRAVGMRRDRIEPRLAPSRESAIATSYA